MKLPDFLTDEWFWAMWQFVGVTASLIYLNRQVHAQRSATMISTINTLRERWGSPEMKEARRRICEDYKAAGIPNSMTPDAHQVASFFNSLGAFTEKRVLDMDMVWSRHSHDIEGYWLLLKIGISTYRRENGDDDSWFRSFENLYPKIHRATWSANQEKRYKQRFARFHKLPTLNATQTKDVLDQFVERELALVKDAASSSELDTTGIPGLLQIVAMWLDKSKR